MWHHLKSLGSIELKGRLAGRVQVGLTHMSGGLASWMKQLSSAEAVHWHAYMWLFYHGGLQVICVLTRQPRIAWLLMASESCSGTSIMFYWSKPAQTQREETWIPHLKGISIKELAGLFQNCHEYGGGGNPTRSQMYRGEDYVSLKPEGHDEAAK